MVFRLKIDARLPAFLALHVLFSHSLNIHLGSVVDLEVIFSGSQDPALPEVPVLDFRFWMWFNLLILENFEKIS